jgi:Cu-Zn family superoxide dismutase
VVLSGLKPGVHAIHIHEKSDCSAADGSSAGDIEPTFKNHGKWGVGQYHKGDIGNFTADKWKWPNNFYNHEGILVPGSQ